MERIVNTELGVIREPLRAPFGFKGGTLSELWQTAVRLTLDSGASGMGVGVQSVLWSDPVTFCACDEAGGNERMLAVTRRALELLQGQAFTDPPGMTAGLVPELLAFARRLLGRADVPQTFVLNALVPVDFALWQLWNAKRGNGTFDALCASFCPELTNREKELGSIPLITYHTPEDELHALLEDGAFLLKVKIGSDPEKNGDPEAMLAWDIGRLRTVHTAAAGFTTPYTECGRPVYYLDANGRYPDREFLLRFLDAADKMDALERIVLLEEPFAGDRPEPVHGLPVRVAGDESAHSAQDVARLLQEAGKQLQIFIPVVVRDDHMDPQLLPRFGLGAVFAPEPLEDLGLGLVITGDVGLIIQGQQPCKVEAVNHFIQGVDDGGNPLLHQAWQLRRRDAQIFRSHHLLLDIADPAV